eukprot:364088-Rhodomonas_salina.2
MAIMTASTPECFAIAYCRAPCQRRALCTTLVGTWGCGTVLYSGLKAMLYMKLQEISCSRIALCQCLIRLDAEDAWGKTGSATCVSATDECVFIALSTISIPVHDSTAKCICICTDGCAYTDTPTTAHLARQRLSSGYPDSCIDSLAPQPPAVQHWRASCAVSVPRLAQQARDTHATPLQNHSQRRIARSSISTWCGEHNPDTIRGHNCSLVDQHTLHHFRTSPGERRKRGKAKATRKISTLPTLSELGVIASEDPKSRTSWQHHTLVSGLTSQQVTMHTLGLARSGAELTDQRRPRLGPPDARASPGRTTRGVTETAH